MKKFICGFICGAILFSITSLASEIIAVLSPQSIVLNGEKANITAYNILGNNYFKLVDLAKEIDFNVKYDEPTNTVYIDTTKEFSEKISVDIVEESPSTIPTNTDYFIPTENSTYLLTDGSTYTFTDMKKYDKSLFAEGSVGELPKPTCDWTEFPELDIPPLEIRHFNTENGDYLFVSNIKETKRMIYTLYNAIGKNSEVWDNGLKKSSKGNDLVKVKIGITSDFAVQSFYPFYVERLTEVFNSCPIGTYSFESWDVYRNGIFQYTEYKFQID